MTNKEKLIEMILNLSDVDAERFMAFLIEQTQPKPSFKPYRRIIYSIKNNVTGREYIGRTQNFDNRIAHHMADLKRGVHPVSDMQRDFDDYGDDFTISILEEVTGFENRKREYELIEEHGSYIRGKGYNYRDTTFRRWKAAKERAE